MSTRVLGVLMAARREARQAGQYFSVIKAMKFSAEIKWTLGMGTEKQEVMQKAAPEHCCAATPRCSMNPSLTNDGYPAVPL